MVREVEVLLILQVEVLWILQGDNFGQKKTLWWNVSHHCSCVGGGGGVRSSGSLVAMGFYHFYQSEFIFLYSTFITLPRTVLRVLYM